MLICRKKAQKDINFIAIFCQCIEIFRGVNNFFGGWKLFGGMRTPQKICPWHVPECAMFCDCNCIIYSFEAVLGSAEIIFHVTGDIEKRKVQCCGNMNQTLKDVIEIQKNLLACPIEEYTFKAKVKGCHEQVCGVN